MALPAGRAVVFGSGAASQVRVSDARWAPRQLSLTAQADGVALEALAGDEGVRLDEVPLGAAALLQPGDELRLGEVRLLVALARPTEDVSRVRLAGAEELLVR
ncbi:MAG: hypothetical protein K1X89_31810, partial [Myxococcaceae bacterium]|nr:hypothetical protein [Myxococcaceae bacterium]